MDVATSGRRARFAAPTPPVGFVERTRLDDRYAQSTGRVVRVLAPGGYGKTSLAARWVASDAREVRWADLDPVDDDPIAMLETLRQALADIVDVPWPSTSHVAAEEPFVLALRQAFTGHATGRPGPFVLVLDDLHHLRSAGSGRLVDTLVEQLPPTSTLVLVGRAHHDHDAIGRFRLSPGMVDVTVDDLAFDVSESRRLLGSIGIDLDTSDLATVMDELDGWPAGLRLAGLVMLDSPGATTTTDIFEHVAIVDYLRGEWTGRLDDRDLEFLREIACLERCTGDMCDRVLGRAGSTKLLQRLHRDELVVLPLDQRGRWYRLHPLLSRWLAGDLRDDDPRRWAEIHAEAATYWELEGHVDLAVEHARRAGDLGLWETLVTRHGGNYFTRGMDATVQAWLGAFPAEHVRESPGLCALSVIAALHRGDEERAVQWQHLLDQTVGARSEPERRSDPSTSWASILHAALDERPAAELVPVAEEARQHLRGGPWLGFLWWVLGALHFLDGDVEQAEKALQAGLFEADLSQDPLLTAHCLGTGAVIADCAGDRSEAHERTRRAKAELHACHGELLAPVAPVSAMHALVSARGGDREEAVRSLEAARRGLTGFRSIAPWLNVVARLALVRTTLLLDDREASRTLMSELEHHARFESSEHGAIGAVRELREQVDALPQAAGRGSELTDAELSVLRYLPTYLSLSDIASRLFVSRNTVKTHAAAIYRKLGATRRREAVDLARAAGLLDDP